MKRWPVRCRNGKCRARRLSTVHPDEALRRVRCHACGGMHGWRVEYQGPERRELCLCNSVVSEDGRTYPHRKGQHPYCDHHPLGFRNQAIRAGVTDPEELFGIAVWDCPGEPCTTDEPPF